MKTFRNPRLFRGAETTNVDPAPNVLTDVIARSGWGECSTTWGTRGRNAPSTFSLPTLSIFALAAESISTPTCQTSPYPAAATPTALYRPLSDWSSKTVCRIGRPPGIFGVTTVSLCHSPRSRTGLRRQGKKGEARIEADYLDWALRGFSGYIAIDELYDGPFCVLSIVDNRNFKRLLYEVVDHDPTHEDIQRFLQRFQLILQSRELKLKEITSDASPLYPKPIAATKR